MEEFLRALLLGDADIAALVADRVDWGAARQGAGLPAIVLQVVSDRHDMALGGRVNLDMGIVQVDCIALDYATAKATSRAVKALLSGYSGGALQGVFFAGARESRAGGSNEAERPFVHSLDFETRFTSEE